MEFRTYFNVNETKDTIYQNLPNTNTEAIKEHLVGENG